MTAKAFRKLIWSWYRLHGRHNLPWRKLPQSLPAGRQAYRILISEVMLQQTQVSRVITKYRQFIAMFGTLRALNRAPLSAVLTAWQGMGYNRRAVYLKRLARMIMEKHNGRIPQDADALEKLPGIGPGTAGAVLAFAFGRRTAFIETNIRRVFIHHFFKRRRRVSDTEILKKIRQTLPRPHTKNSGVRARRNIREWYYALMDCGADALRNIENPNRRSASYSRPSPFKGSRRELRGRILAAALTAENGIPLRELSQCFDKYARAENSFRRTVAQLSEEGLLTLQKGRVLVPPGEPSA